MINRYNNIKLIDKGNESNMCVYFLVFLNIVLEEKEINLFIELLSIYKICILVITST